MHVVVELRLAVVRAGVRERLVVLVLGLLALGAVLLVLLLAADGLGGLERAGRRDRARDRLAAGGAAARARLHSQLLDRAGNGARGDDLAEIRRDEVHRRRELLDVDVRGELRSGALLGLALLLFLLDGGEVAAVLLLLVRQEVLHLLGLLVSLCGDLGVCGLDDARDHVLEWKTHSLAPVRF